MVVTYNVDRVGLIQMPTQKLTAEILAAAIEGFEAQKRRIDEQIAQVRQMLDGRRVSSTLRHPAWEFTDLLPLTFGRVEPAC